MADVKQLVRELAISLPEGCSMRAICPECHHKDTFNMSRTNGEVRFICFRANCTCRGVITSKGSEGSGLDPKVIRQRKLFSGTLSALEIREIEYLMDKFNIEPEWLEHVRWGEDDDRIYYPQYDMTGRVHGYIARYYPELNDNRKLIGAKALWKQVLPAQLGLCFPNMQVLEQVVKSNKLCVVEDYPSMLRINSQAKLPTCCLGGTNIYGAHVDDMITIGVKELIILLDADAVTKAVKLKRGLSLAFDNVKVIPLTGADPKDMGLRELNKLLKGV